MHEILSSLWWLILSAASASGLTALWSSSGMFLSQVFLLLTSFLVACRPCTGITIFISCLRVLGWVSCVWDVSPTQLSLIRGLLEDPYPPLKLCSKHGVSRSPAFPALWWDAPLPASSPSPLRSGGLLFSGLASPHSGSNGRQVRLQPRHLQIEQSVSVHFLWELDVCLSPHPPEHTSLAWTWKLSRDGLVSPRMGG